MITDREPFGALFAALLDKPDWADRALRIELTAEPYAFYYAEALKVMRGRMQPGDELQPCADRVPIYEGLANRIIWKTKSPEREQLL